MTEPTDLRQPVAVTWLPYGDMMRCIAAATVIVLHVSFQGVEQYRTIARGEWWVCAWVQAATRWAVPVFVMLSGALLLGGDKVESVGTFYRKRLRRIGVPLLFWSAFYIAWSVLFKGEDVTLAGAGKLLLMGKPYPHMYFMFIIAGLYIVAPLLRAFVRRSSAGMLLGVTVLLLVLMAGDQLVREWTFAGPRSAFTKFVPYVGYFLAGAYLRNVAVTRKTLALAWTGFLVALAATALGTGCLVFHVDIGRYWMLYDYLGPFIIVMSICAFVLIKGHCAGMAGGSSSWRRLGALTLGVYLVHPVFIDIAARFGLTVTTGGVWLGIPLVTLCALAGSCLIVAIIARIPYLRSVVGG